MSLTLGIFYIFKLGGLFHYQAIYDLFIFHLHLLYQPFVGFVKLHVFNHTRYSQGR